MIVPETRHVPFRATHAQTFFASEDEYEVEYEFSVLSMRIRFGGRHFSKCACSERKTRSPRSTYYPCKTFDAINDKSRDFSSQN